MSITNTLKVSFKKFKSEKTNIYLVIMYMLIFLIILVSFSIISTINNYVKNLQNDYYYRVFFLDRESIDGEDKMIADLKEIPHVDLVFDSKYLTASININTINNQKVSNGYINLKNNKETSYNEIICPKIFIPKNLEETEYYNKDNIVKIDSGTKIEATYKEFINETEYETKNVSLTVTKLYDNNGVYIDENECYANPNFIKDLTNAYSISENSNSVFSLAIIVDNTDNIDNVVNNAAIKGYSLIPALTISHNLINFINTITITISLICIIGVILLINNIYQKKYLSNKQELAIYRVLGYKKKDINRIMIYENLISSAISIIIILLITLIIKIIISILLNVNPFIFLKIPIIINLNAILIGFFINTLIIILLNKKLSKTMYKEELSTILEV